MGVKRLSTSCRRCSLSLSSPQLSGLSETDASLFSNKCLTLIQPAHFAAIIVVHVENSYEYHSYRVISYNYVDDLKKIIIKEFKYRFSIGFVFPVFVALNLLSLTCATERDANKR